MQKSRTVKTAAGFAFSPLIPTDGMSDAFLHKNPPATGRRIHYVHYQVTITRTLNELSYALFVKVKTDIPFARGFK